MTDHNNRLSHWMGPKKVIWIPEQDLKMYRDPTSFKVPEEGVEFLVQHHIHGNWVHGVFIREKDQWNDRITIKWTPVIVIRKNRVKEAFHNPENVMFRDWWDQQESIWEPGFVPQTWTTEQGGIVFIKDMATSHITNCISWLKRERAGWPYVDRMIAAFEAELARRNENDQLDASDPGSDPLQPT